MPGTGHTKSKSRKGESSRNAELIRWENGIIRRLKSSNDEQVSSIACGVCNAALDTYAQNVGTEELPPVAKDITEMLYNASPARQRSAVALIKSIADTQVTRVTSQVPHLLRLLNNKKAPPTTKRLCVVTLVRIFTLTQGNTELIRTVTTPSLPSFISTCLTLVASKTPYANKAYQRTRQIIIESVLESFRLLIPLYPTTFRPYESQIYDLISSLVAPTPSSTAVNGCIVISPSPSGVQSAASVHALLHFTASKTEQSRKWNSGVRDVVSEAHSTANEIFRAFLEEWQSNAGYPTPGPSSGEGEPAQQERSKLTGLPMWCGVYAGCERMIGLLGLLRAFIATRTAGSVSFPINAVHDLLRRMFLVTIPPQGDKDNGLRINDAVDRDERDALCSQLPSIHIAALGFIEVLFERFGTSSPKFAHDIINYVLHSFRTERLNRAAHKHYYCAIGHYLQLFGVSLGRDRVQDLADAVRACCEDLTPLKHQVQERNSDSNANCALSHETAYNLRGEKEARQAALSLIEACLAKVPSEHTPSSIRSQMLRTAILSGDERVMLASTINPSPVPIQGGANQSSIVPFLARAHNNSITTEALVRPRLPPLAVASSMNVDVADSISEDMHEVSPDRDSTEDKQNRPTTPPKPFAVPEFSVQKNSSKDHPERVMPDASFATPAGMVIDEGQPPEPNSTGVENSVGKTSSSAEADTFKLTASSLSTGDARGPAKRQKSPEEASEDPVDGSEDIKEIKRVRLESPEGDTVMAGVDVVDASEEDKGDDDDFVIPALTMEPDTDEEDESEIEEKGEE
ncbi:MAG: hypothetical protein M1831_002016 [Alyxoria varia]|nr:MAG: hypothetical protein M1831_002016 [Alyxoria varia]